MRGQVPSLADIDAELARRQVGGTYRTDPVAFAHDCVTWRPGEGLAEYQDEALAELPVRRRVAVRGPHGLGKTTVAALAVLWYGLTRDAWAAEGSEDWKAPTTASAWRQLTKYLWPEVHKWARRLRWERLGRARFDDRSELQVLSLKLAAGEAFALASDDHAMLEGAHARHLLYVFDEAKSIPAATWDAAEGAFSTAGGDTGGEALALAISTPGAPSGRFYDIHARRHGYEDWWVRHVTLDEAVRAGRISREWAEARRRQWGENSPLYQNRVLGQFAASDEASVIPLAWVEAAVERWHTRRLQMTAEDQALDAVGVDVGLTAAETVLAPRTDDFIHPLRAYARIDTMTAAGHVAALVRARGGRPVVDVVGIGAGVHHRLREGDGKERGVDSVAFVAGAKTDARDRSGELRFANLRAAAWWGLRERLDPQYGPTACLPPDDGLLGDLTAPRWKMTSDGRVLIEAKEEITTRLGRSTDRGDAVVMAFALEIVAPRRSRVFGAPVGIGEGSYWRGAG